MTLPVAAAKLGVGLSTLYNRLAAGTIPELRAFKHPGPFNRGRWCIPIDAIDEILAMQGESRE